MLLWEVWRECSFEARVGFCISLHELKKLQTVRRSLGEESFDFPFKSGYYFSFRNHESSPRVGFHKRSDNILVNGAFISSAKNQTLESFVTEHMEPLFEFFSTSHKKLSPKIKLERQVKREGQAPATTKKKKQKRAKLQPSTKPAITNPNSADAYSTR